MTYNRNLFGTIERPDDGWGLRHARLLLSVLLFGISLTSSLIPGVPAMQGMLGGLVAVLAYWMAMWGFWLWRVLDLPVPHNRLRPRIRVSTFLISLAFSAGFLWNAADWQTATRTVMQRGPVETSHSWTIAVLAACGFLLVLIGQRLGVLLWGLDQRPGRIQPPRPGTALGFVLGVWLFAALVDGVLVRKVFQAAGASFEAADTFIEPGTPQPTNPLKTRSPEVLVDWPELGRWGRSFVATVPTTLKTNAFSIPAPMDLARHDRLDFMLGRDVAAGEVLYSHLTNARPLLTNPASEAEQAREMFDVIYTSWTALPANSRPKLFAHGPNGGAFSSQMTFPLLDILGNPFNGARWAGSPFLSPAWRTRNGDGSLVHVTDQGNSREQWNARRGPMRLVFLHSASAPNMAISLQVPRNGQSDLAPDFIDAWAELAQPTDWSPERAALLKDIFEQRPLSI